jgi:hypothetical protein
MTDVPELTVSVLAHGLGETRTDLREGQLTPVACWRGSNYGAVLFFGLSTDGLFESVCAITRRLESGWELPQGWGGGAGGHPLWDDASRSFTRPMRGWDGQPVLWLGVTGLGLWHSGVRPDAARGEDIDDLRLNARRRGFRRAARRHPRPMLGDSDVRVLQAAASAQVSVFEATQDQTGLHLVVEPSSVGAALLGIEGGPTVRVSAKDRTGVDLVDEHGHPVEAVF